MRGAVRSTRAVMAALALSLVVVTPSLAWPATPGAAVRGSSELDLLPDLELAPVYGVSIATADRGRKRLRFGVRAFNIGAGTLEVRGRAPSGKVMGELYQWITDVNGGGREVPQQNVTMFWAGDGHSHWHVERFIAVELYKVDTLTQARRARKIGFCLLDLIRSSSPPAHAPAQRVYGYKACGTTAKAPSLTMGISVGYADDYFPTTAFNWIDITRLPRGHYRLCAKVNPVGDWLEASMENNFYWQDYWINPARSVARKRNTPGRTPCGMHG
jgi:hypothetical protein